MGKALFTDGETSDAVYRNIRDAKSGPLYSARFHCEYFWKFFERHADKDFLSEIRRTFNARYWEMYFTTSLVLSGYEVTCPKPGPDVGIIHGGKRLWFECVSPTPGDPDKPNYVAPPEMGGVFDVPNERMVLRYLNSISEKYERQYSNWIAKGVISKYDAFVIALNPKNISFEYADTNPPRILQAAYTVGPRYVTIDRGTGKVAGAGYHFRDHIKKTASAASGNDAQKPAPATVTTGVFQDRRHDGLSGLLCSRVDAANRSGELGSDFQLAPNPHAVVPLPQGLRLRGTYYDVKILNGEYQVMPVPGSRP